MTSVENFTTLSPGVIALDGRVGLCPRCGRPGIEKSWLGTTSFVHTQSTEVLGDGMVTVPLDSCTLSPLPFDAHDSDAI